MANNEDSESISLPPELDGPFYDQVDDSLDQNTNELNEPTPKKTFTKHFIANILGLDDDKQAPSTQRMENFSEGAPSTYVEPARMVGGARKKGAKKRQQRASVSPPKQEPSPHNKMVDPKEFDGENFTCVSAAQAGAAQYKGFRFVARFSLHSLHRELYPEEALKQIFKICLQKAKQGILDELHMIPNHYIFSLQSDVLDYGINSHLKKINKSDVEELLSLFEKIDQSNRNKGRESICEGLFTVDVLAVKTSGRKRKMMGAGRKPKKDFGYNIHPGALYNHPPFPQGYCLFYSLEWIRQKHLATVGAYRRWKENPKRMKKTVEELMKACGIEEGHDAYSIYDCGRHIQDYFDDQNPGIFRLIVFGTHGDFKPLYKSNVRDYEIPIVLMYDEEQEHYEPVEFPGQLFMEKGKYCYPCERPYRDMSRHKISCRGRCKNCQKVGLFPCKSDGIFNKICPECNKVFINSECYQRHLLRRRPNYSTVCERVSKCRSCGVIWDHSTRKNKQPKSPEESCDDESVTLGSQDTEFPSDMDLDEELDCDEVEEKQPKMNFQIRKENQIMDNKKEKRPQHICGERWCRKCKRYHLKRPCWILPRPRAQKDRRIIVYDFEASQHLQPDPCLPRFQHQINFAFAHVMCYRCVSNGSWNKEPIKPCVICGENRTYSWASFDYQGSEQHMHTQVKKDEDILPDFVHWLLHFEEENINDDRAKKDEYAAGKKNSRFETICYAHNGSRYDHVFVFGEIIRAGGLRPNIIRQGNTLLEMKVKKPGIITSTTFRDTLKIIPIGLAKFVKTFDLQIPGIPGKMYFPYQYNVPKNYEIELPHLPKKELYTPGAMFPPEREAFLKWYEQNKGTPFCLKDILAEYCIADVKILAHGLVKMRQLFLDVTQTDITESITLPSALMRYFVSTFENRKVGKRSRLWVALTPHLGYDNHDKQSLLARNYIKYWADKHKQEVQFCESPQGEYVYRNKYKLDCLVRRGPGQKDLAIEIFGCYWHGCPRCYPDEDQIVGYGETAGAIRKRDAQRITELEEEMEVRIKWECDIRRRQLLKEEMQEFFADCLDTGPIDIHEAFFGGRTGCERIMASAIEENGDLSPNDPGHRTIKYKDFVSLYPYVNYKAFYPVTHPETKVYNGYNGHDVNWSRPKDIVCPESGQTIRGIVKCFVVPPLHVKNDIPAVPLRMKERLLFPLCKSCATQFPDGLKDDEYSCEHREDSERGFVSTITTRELTMGLEAGYRVTKLIRCWNWPKDSDWSDDLFKPYIRKFMQIKYEATGWPPHCLEEGISEEERARRKNKVIQDAYLESGIVLNEDKIEFNPGLRYVAKICLNSLWGRFALRNRLTKSVIVQDAAGLAEYLDNERIDVTLIEPLSERNWLICYKMKDVHVVENYASNPIVALYTTANARCHLLKHLWMANEGGRSDVRIIYMDTDSIIYDYNTSLGDPLPTGSQLGQLNDEYPSKDILEFLSLGPKAYSLWLKDPQTGKEEYVKKCRGIPLNFDSNERLCYERMKKMVLNTQNFHRDDNFEMFPELHFRLSRQGDIMTVPMTKKLRPTYMKGVHRGWRIVPFGYVHHE